jgi:hypothetical protein
MAAQSFISKRATYNWHFLQNYQPYVIAKWKNSYFAYDKFKDFYKHEKKNRHHFDIEHYEADFCDEIHRLYHFITGISHRIDEDLTTIENDILNCDGNKVFDEAQRDRNFIMSLRSLYEEIQNVEKFYHLNYYSIVKIGKKYDKLIKLAAKNDRLGSSEKKSSKPSSKKADFIRQVSGRLKNIMSKKAKTRDTDEESLHVKSWRDFSSGSFFYDEFVSTLPALHLLKSRCITIYSKKFRKTYGEVAEYELKYVKIPDLNSGPVQFRLGLKFGVIFCMIGWLVAYSSIIQHEFDFWTQPGLFIYTMIGNLLLYRFAWAANIFVWSKMGINYISALQLSNSKPNLLLVANQTATLLLFYFMSLMIFCMSNIENSALKGTYLSYGSPFLLLLVSILYQIYESVFLFGNKHVSRGVFGVRVFQNMLIAPFAAVRFRDVYVADVLTSFNRVIADTLYACCWIISGSFATRYTGDGSLATSTNFGTSFLNCSNHDMVYVVSFLQLMPLVTRTLQCFRGIYDARGNLYPQGYNALKYMISIFVVYVGLFHSDNLLLYYSSIAFATCYKWWWDVVMDWGLCEVLPLSIQEIVNWRNYSFEGKLFLRHQLMIPWVSVYYISIFVDLVLRFLWVVSLLPPGTLGILGGYKLSFFMGAMEILRRSMWGILRVEWEHLKLMKQHAPGILGNHMNEKLFVVSRKSLVQMFTTHVDTYEPLKEEDEDCNPSIRSQKSSVPFVKEGTAISVISDSVIENPILVGEFSEANKMHGKLQMLADDFEAVDDLDDSL